MEQKAIDYSGLVASICEKRLEELFPAGIPLDVSERFSRELRCMNETGHAKTLYEYYVFADAAEEALIPLMVRGLANDSILTYLLGNNMVNPLEAYYYCPSCGYYERIPDYWYGIDATVKKCPKCGQGIQGQGFSLNWRILWGTRGTRGIHFEYIAPPSFLPYARNCVEALYPDNVVVELADDEFRIVYGTDEDVIKRGFAVLPTGKNEEDYLDKKYIFPDGSSAYILDIEAENEGVIRIIFNWFKPEDLLKIMLPASSTSLSMRDILKYGYLAYRYIEFYGINSVQKKESDMVKQTKYLNQYFNRTIGYVALENIGDGTYALVSPEDKVYEYSSDDNSIRDTEMKLFDYILSRFKEADAQQ